MAVASTGDPLASAGCCDSACSTPFVSAPSSPARDHHPFSGGHLHGACFFSAPTSPTRGAGGSGAGPGCLDFDFDFDFSSRFPSPSAAAMSSADELFCNGQIRPVRLAAALLQPRRRGRGGGGGRRFPGGRRGRCGRAGARAEPVRAAEGAVAVPVQNPLAVAFPHAAAGRGRIGVGVRRRAGGDPRRVAVLVVIVHRLVRVVHVVLQRLPPVGLLEGPPPEQVRRRQDSPSSPPSRSGSTNLVVSRRSAAAAGRGRRRSAHERLYEARRAEAEEMRRRTYLPYRQGLLLFGCIGLGNRGYGAVHGLARGLNAAAAVSSRSGHDP